MGVYVVIPTMNAHAIGQTVAKHFPGDHYNLTDATWLVASPKTVQEVSQILGITDGSIGLGVVFLTNAYFGRADLNLWPWIKAKAEATGGV